MSDPWDGAEPVVVLGYVRMCNGTTAAGGAIMHTRHCPFHGETEGSLRAEVAALTAERDARDDLSGDLHSAQRCGEPGPPCPGCVIDRLTAERDALDAQIKRLADFIMFEVPGEPSQSQGAVDTVIRLFRALDARLEQAEKVVEAAVAWRGSFVHTRPAEWDRVALALIAAVDSYQAGTADG